MALHCACRQHRRRTAGSPPVACRNQLTPKEYPVTPSSQPILAIIDVDITSGKDEVAREQMLYNLRNYRGNGVTPLWTNLSLIHI